MPCFVFPVSKTGGKNAQKHKSLLLAHRTCYHGKRPSYICINIYLEPFDDPCFDWKLDLVLEGSNPKVEDIHRFQLYIARTRLTSILEGRGPSKTRPFHSNQNKGPHLGTISTF